VSELDKALDALDGEGTVQVDRGSHQAEVEVADAGRLGVSVRRVRVHRSEPVDVAQEAMELPNRLRSLPERVTPVEVDPTLGGARLRTDPDDLRGGEFFEVDVSADETTVQRTRIDEEGDRHSADFTLTREQLDRLIDEAAGPPS